MTIDKSYFLELINKASEENRQLDPLENVLVTVWLENGLEDIAYQAAKRYETLKRWQQLALDIISEIQQSHAPGEVSSANVLDVIRLSRNQSSKIAESLIESTDQIITYELLLGSILVAVKEYRNSSIQVDELIKRVESVLTIESVLTAKREAIRKYLESQK